MAGRRKNLGQPEEVIRGELVHSAALGGAPTGILDNEYYYDYTWSARKASGLYFAVIHGKMADGTIVKARAKFAVIRYESTAREGRPAPTIFNAG